MQYIESNEMYNLILSRYFSNKTPKFVKAAKTKAAKTKVAEDVIEFPSDLEAAIALKKDYKKSFGATYDPAVVERFWNDWWIKNGFYHTTAQEAKEVDPSKRFVMILPPPNVTGYLHIGHGLTGAIQDTLVRWKKMKGFKTVYVPGVDHAGIATQSVVERTLAREGVSKYDIGREKFIERVWQWKEHYGNTITEQLKKIGSSLDWERYAFTMDKPRSVAVKEAFCRLYSNNLIYRANRLVNWSCSLKTAISNIEVDHIEVKGFDKLSVPGYSQPIEFGALVDFAYKVKDSGEEIVVSTTRIETMLGDVAVAVHSQDSRYKHLIGKKLQHPFIKDRLLDVVVDDTLVKMDVGTGAVKVTPAHDPNDYECGKRNKLAFINILNDDGTMNETCGPYANMKRYDVRVQLLKDLESLGLYRGKKANPMSLSICNRSGDVIEPRLKPQWYVDCKDISKRLVSVVENKELVLVPQSHEKTWFHFMNNLEDWCISRQLWWGHQIPAYQCRLTDGTFLRDEEGQVKWYVGRTYHEALEAAKQANPNLEFTLVQDEDVLDTWFSSALLPFSNFGWPDVSSEDFKAFFPNTMLETGYDILFFWVARMAMMSLMLLDTLPFKTVLLHNIVRDEEGQKMSKSKGNVIDPLELIDGCELKQLLAKIQNSILPDKEKQRSMKQKKEALPNGIPKCGSDAMRFALLNYVSENKDINFDLNIPISFRNFCTKIWNSYKLVRMTLPEDYLPRYSESEFLGYSKADLWILSELHKTIKEVNESFENYKFGAVTDRLSSFWFKKFCDFYLEYSKTINKDDKASLEHTHNVLFYVLETFLRMLHPTMPFISEELYQKLPQYDGKCASVLVSKYPEPNEAFIKPEFGSFKKINTIIKTIRQLSGVVKLPPKSNPAVYLYLKEDDSELVQLVNEYKAYIAFMAKAGEIIIERDSARVPKECIKGSCLGKADICVYVKGLVKVSEEIGKLDKDIAEVKKAMEKLEQKFSQPNYDTKVPEAVRDREKKAYDAHKAKLESVSHTREVLAALI